MVNADQGKYGSVIKGLNYQKYLNNDPFPKTMIDGNNVLSNHRFDNVKNNNNTRNQNNRDGKSNNDKNEQESVSLDESPSLSFVQMEGKCYCCGKKGHKSPACNNRKKTPREEWAINKAQMAHIKQ